MLKVIPTLSSIVERLLGLISNNDSSFNDLNDVIKYDQSISSKIISIANSAYYSRGVEVFSLQRAMMTIGFEEVKKIVMCLLFMNDMLKSLNLKGKDLIDLWKHSAYVACAARTLSKKTLVEDPQKVFTISLLHDIGKTVLYINAENYHAVLKKATEKGERPRGDGKGAVWHRPSGNRLCHRGEMAFPRGIPLCHTVSSWN